MAKSFSYDRLLESLYSSITSSDSLVDFLQQLNLGLRSHVSGILTHDGTTGRGSFPAIVGMPPTAVIEYEQRYVADNLWMQRITPNLTVGRIDISDQIVSLDELRRTNFWREYLSLVEIDHSVGLCGAKDDLHVAELSISRSHRVGEYNAAELELLRRLGPHWVNACQIRKQLGTLHDTVVSLETALNRIALAVIFIDGNGVVSRVNHGAERMLRHGHVLTLRSGHLVARNSIDALRLSRAIAEASCSAATPGASVPAAVRLTLHDSAGVPTAYASVRPLANGSVQHNVGQTHSTVVFIRNLAADSPRNVCEALAELFDLTAGEARLAAELHRQGDLAAAAASVGLSVEAARSRLKLVFDKTGAHSQTLLVKVIEEVSSVLGGDDG